MGFRVCKYGGLNNQNRVPWGDKGLNNGVLRHNVLVQGIIFAQSIYYLAAWALKGLVVPVVNLNLPETANLTCKSTTLNPKP